MAINIEQSSNVATEKTLIKAKHILFVWVGEVQKNSPFQASLEAKLKRNKTKAGELAKKPVSVDLPNGGIASWLLLQEQSAFQRQTLLRKAIKPLLDESPSALHIVLIGEASQLQKAARDAVYVTLVNAAELPQQKKKDKSEALKQLFIHGVPAEADFADVAALAAGNSLTRQLTMLAPNLLTPTLYRKKIADLAKTYGWKHEEFDMPKLKKMGAGAFVAVGQGSEPQDAAIVHLSYHPKGAKKHIALVGKGICFDTGGHNLKAARYMQGMHEDMNGSAVALGILQTLTEQKLPIKVDCWLAIAQNHIGPKAYKQNDIVTALNGKTIEIVHTDAEGRMVLSDTLTLASREKPDLIIDYATLTGSMITAVGDRYSGIMGNRPEMLCKAVGAGMASGERVNAFPFDEDYDEDLESDVADIKQCTLDSEADHVLAARFLSKFIEHDVSWLHVDLSAVKRKGGLGAVASDVTGFGVAFTTELIWRVMD